MHPLRIHHGATRPHARLLSGHDGKKRTAVSLLVVSVRHLLVVSLSCLVVSLSPVPPGTRPVLAQGGERWEAWWQRNREPFLDLKRRIKEPPLTEEDDFSLGRPDADNVRHLRPPQPPEVRATIIPALLRALSEDAFEVRSASVLALGKAGSRSELPRILEVLGDDHVDVRAKAIVSLGVLGDPGAIEVLNSLIRDDRAGRRRLGRSEILPRERALAAAALGLIGRVNPDERDMIRARLTRGVDLEGSPRDLPQCALLALGLLDDEEAASSLIATVKNGDIPDLLRAQAVASLGKLGHSRHLSFVQKAMGDDNHHVLRSAVLALGRLAPPGDPRSVQLLSYWATQGKETLGRGWSLISLGRIGGESARKVLRRTIETDQDWRKAWAALGLALAARSDGDLTEAPVLHRLFRTTKGDSLKSAYAIALGLMGYREARFDLANVVRAKGDPALRGNCAIALGLMGARDTSPLIQLALRLRLDPGLQRSTATALGMMGDPEVVPLLIEILESADTEYEILSAAAALGFIGDVAAIAPLVRILEDPTVSRGSRAAAASALGVIGEERLLPVLSEIDQDSNYRALTGTYRELLNLE